MVKINPLFFVVVLIVWLSGHIITFSIMFLILLIHEMTHLLFMLKNKIAVSKIVIEPFGISITSKDMKEENAVTAWIYLSAPLLNLAIGAVIFTFPEKSYYVNYFMLANFTLGIFNLIPAVPFDGGRALNLILAKKYGKLSNFSHKISFSISLILIISGIYLVYITKFNFSVIIVGIFLLYNSLAEKELLMQKAAKHYASLEKRGALAESLPIIYLAVPKNYSTHKLIRQFKPENYYIVKVIDNGIVIKTLTETQIIKKLLSENKSLKVLDL